MSGTERLPPGPPPRRPRWAAPPLPPAATRAERRARKAYEDESRCIMRWIWEVVGESAGMIGPITFGPPTRFSVALRPDRSGADVVAMAARLTMAYRVDDVVIRHLAEGWVSVELVEAPTSTEPWTAEVQEPVDQDGESAGDSRPRAKRRPTHLGPRGRRRPYGRPSGLGG